MPRSSRGLGRQPLTLVTRVRIPYAVLRPSLDRMTGVPVSDSQMTPMLIGCVPTFQNELGIIHLEKEHVAVSHLVQERRHDLQHVWILEVLGFSLRMGVVDEAFVRRSAFPR